MKVRELVPNVITIMNLCCGFAAIIQEDIIMSVAFIAMGMIFDVLDGFVARLLHAPSNVGKELDSLADMVTFGVAPAYIYYSLAEIPKLGVIAGFFIIAGSAIRLARFNLKEAKSDFEGLPTPAMTAILLGLFIAYVNEQPVVKMLFSFEVIYLAIPILLTFFMNSKITMFSLKAGFLSLRENPGPILVLSMLVFMIFLNKEMAVLITSVSYIFISILLNRIKR